MSLQLDEATAQLQQLLLAGIFAPGEKLKEQAVAEKLGSSRTIARLAMSSLEAAGLLVREANRGSRARAFSIEEIAAAIEVRGELEAMAVRLAAERGLEEDDKCIIETCIEAAEELLSSEVENESQKEKWVRLNTEIHDRFITASGNWAIDVAVKQISILPLVSSASIIFDRVNKERGLIQLRLSHYDHIGLFEAVSARQGGRAEALMREHAFKSAQNKRRNLSEPKTFALARNMPGAALISPGAESAVEMPPKVRSPSR